MGLPSTASKVTITADYGPGLQATALVINHLREIRFDIDRQVLFVVDDTVTTHEFALDTIATVTFSIASKVYTITVSE